MFLCDGKTRSPIKLKKSSQVAETVIHLLFPCETAFSRIFIFIQIQDLCQNFIYTCGRQKTNKNQKVKMKQVWHGDFYWLIETRLWYTSVS